MDRVESALSTLMVRWVRGVDRRARSTLLLIALATVGLTWFTLTHLGVNSDGVTMLGEHIEARKNYLEFSRSFPNIENVMLIVVDGETPEIARKATTRLEEALSAETDLFHDVYVPGSGEFFERYGLLYRDIDDLDEFGLQIARVQPVLTALEREPTIANLASLIETGLEESREDEDDDALEEMALILDRIGDATVQAYREFPIEISWEEILLRGSSVETVTQWVIVADPILDFDRVFAATEPIDAVRRIAEENDLDAERGVRVRITGLPALNYEEMWGIFWDVGVGGAICFFVVVFALWRALHSMKLVIASILTLLVGLLWTGAVAAASVGSINLISISFAILFIGLGVDFAIHLGMNYADALRSHVGEPNAHDRALDDALSNVGASLIICTITTATGFYVFIPTDNLGVAELGQIAGSGMIVNLFLTSTLYPALLTTFCRVDPSHLPRPLRFRNTWWSAVTHKPGWVTSISLLLLGIGIWIALGARFDANVVAMRDPDTESVQTFNELLDESGQKSPWPVDTIAPDIESAVELARRVEELPVVELALTIADYVPEDQEEKLLILEDVGMILDAPRNVEPYSENPTIEEQVRALRSLRDYLADPGFDRDPRLLAASMRTLRRSLDDFLARIDDDENPEEALARLEVSLLGGLSEQIKRLRDATLIEEVGLEDLPPELRKRMLTPDGRARIQIFPSEQLTDEAAFTRFSREVQSIAPDVTGLSVNLIAFGDATRDSFSEALFLAVVLIGAFLFVLWKRISLMLLVLAPLILANVLTVATMVILDIPFNFVNVVVIPLLLGIGVDSGIHLVHRAETIKRMNRSDESLLSSTTARAVFYSALTTTVSFGTLSLSSHYGMSTLGIVLGIGMTLTVICNLVVLPALLALRSPGSGSSSS